ncbi:MAG: hypothetical protein AB8B91_02045 [Rubripirellula sp.]
MSSDHLNARPARCSLADLASLSIVGVPLSALALMGIWSMVSWWQQSLLLSASERTVVAEALSVDELAVTTWYDRRGSKQQTADLNRLVQAKTALIDEAYLLLPDSAKQLDEVLTFHNPSSSPLIEQVAARAKPVIAELQSLTKSGDRAWLPIVFQGTSTELTWAMHSDGLRQLTQIEFLDAYNKKESRRAIDALALMVRLFGPDNQPSFTADEWVRVSGYQNACNLVLDSLENPQWSLEELDEIQQLFSEPIDRQKHWQDIVRGNLLMAYPWTLNRNSWREGRYSGRMSGAKHQLSLMFLCLHHAAPSEARASAEIRAQMIATPGAGTQPHTTEIDRLSLGRADWSADQWIQFPISNDMYWQMMPQYFGGTAYRMLADANRQRWTRCAVAIKQFKEKNERYPQSLDELRSIGFPRDATLDFNGRPFRYRTFSGKAAELWNSSIVAPKEEYIKAGISANFVTIR